jgi:hypothetical protein
MLPDLMVNHGSTFEDLVVNPPPTGQYMKAPTLVNYLLLTKVHPLHPFTAITPVQTMESCGINNSCNSTTVNYPLPTVTPTISITR